MSELSPISHRSPKRRLAARKAFRAYIHHSYQLDIAISIDAAKQGLEVLSKVLKAAPIPDPFKSAVTAVPDIALQIIQIVEGVSGNVEDARALAVHIANVTETAMRPFKNKSPGELERSQDTKARLEAFARVLEQIKGEMKDLISRRLRHRILNYESDASKLAAMKERVNNAITDLQLETVVAVGHGVDIIRQNQGRMLESQLQMDQDHRVTVDEQRDRDRMVVQQLTQQQLLMIRQQPMSSQERLDAGS
ncbi:hypothetical protein FRB94_008334 [Tulasnella sp. JGI-2019a]|nr:hypothetical protein FRB94_008334 [Tulasnella sp. JGI-2019a]